MIKRKVSKTKVKKERNPKKVKIVLEKKGYRKLCDARLWELPL